MTFVKKSYDEQVLLHTLSRQPLFKGLSQTDLAPLLRHPQIITFAAGEVLNREGERFNYCPLLLSGQIEVLRHTYEGDEKVFGLFEPPQVVALAAAFMPHQRYPMTLRVKVAGEALLLEHNALIEVSEQCCLVAQRLLCRFSQQLYENMNMIDWLTSSSAEQRLALYLLNLGKTPAEPFMLPLTRSQLAVKLGIRYETLSRLFSHWRKAKIVAIKDNQLTLLQLDYLKNLASPGQRDF